MKMDCRSFALQVDDWLDGRLDVAHGRSMQTHVDGCFACRRGYGDAGALRSALRTLSAPAVRLGFAEQALARAATAPPKGRHAVLGMALAASVVLGLGVAAILFALRAEPMQTLVLTSRQPQNVRLMFNADKALPDATLSLTLPGTVEIVGYGDRRELTWTTDLREGGNLLRLPLVAQGPAGGELVARLTHGSGGKTFRLKIKVRGADATGMPARVASL
jgi:hypothetical protein